LNQAVTLVAATVADATTAVHLVAAVVHVVRLQAAAVQLLLAVVVAVLLQLVVQLLQAVLHRLARFGLLIRFSELLNTQLTSSSSLRSSTRTT